MTFKSDFNLAQGNHPTDKISNNSNNYSPSVPISVYRQLVSELERTVDLANTLKAQNRHLLQQNQFLRQEVNQAIIVIQKLQTQVAQDRTRSAKVIDNSQDRSISKTTRTVAKLPAVKPKQISTKTRKKQQQITELSAVNLLLTPSPKHPSKNNANKKQVIEIPARSLQGVSNSENSARIEGWMLAAVFIAVALTAFSCGFFLIRPLLSSNSNR